MIFYENLTGLPLYLETLKNLEFDNLGKKKAGILSKKTGILNSFNMFNLKQKIFCIDKHFLSS